MIVIIAQNRLKCGRKFFKFIDFFKRLHNLHVVCIKRIVNTYRNNRIISYLNCFYFKFLLIKINNM